MSSEGHWKTWALGLASVAIVGAVTLFFTTVDKRTDDVLTVVKEWKKESTQAAEKRDDQISAMATDIAVMKSTLEVVAGKDYLNRESVLSLIREAERPWLEWRAEINQRLRAIEDRQPKDK